ncbi:MAG: leucine-rich repeat domain-containing protein [Clostridia bacterium]|nr:leucine-rich repeat domain-containing protein [Clostridia bacterium]
MKKTMGFLCAALLAALVFCMLPVPALASELTGSCGENVTYVYDTDSKVLTLSGDGPTNDYTIRQSPFWATAIRNNCTKIVVGEGVTRIGNYLFHFLTKVTDVTLPSTLESIGNYALNNLLLVTEFDLPSGLTQLGENCFGTCKALTTITIPSGVTEIPKQCFNSCLALTSAVLPDGVTAIRDSAFAGCSALAEINIPASLTTIGKTVFSTTQITSVDIPACTTSILNDSFSGAPALTAINVAADNPNYTSVGGVLYNKDKTLLMRCPQGYVGTCEIDPVCEEIHFDAFQNCSVLTSVSIPASVTKIGNQAFQYSGLTSITIPETVTVLENSFCQSCPNLTEATVNASVELLESYAFNGCPSLTNVVLGPSIKSIGIGAFAYCTMLSSIALPDELTAIPNDCFSGCTSLAGIEIPAAVTSIGSNAFDGCTSLTGVTLPDGLVSLGGTAFRQTAITSMTVPAGVTVIEGTVFSACQSLTEVDLLGEITIVRGSAFSNCASLAKVTFRCAPLDPKNANPYAFNGTSESFEIHYPSYYPAWDAERPFDQNGMKYNYVMDVVSAYETIVKVDVRERHESDTIRDMRFTVQLNHCEGSEVTARRVVFTNGANGKTFTLDCPNTLYTAEDGSYELFTAILRNVPRRHYNTEITAQAFIDVTGSWEGTVVSVPMTAKINDILNVD